MIRRTSKKNRMRIGAVATTVIATLLISLSIPLLPRATPNQPPGKLAYKFNIIGVPRDTAAPGAEDGNGRRIFIPLKTDWYTDPCATVGGQNNPDTTLVPTKGVKISVSEGPFDIVDGDAVV